MNRVTRWVAGASLFVLAACESPSDPGQFTPVPVTLEIIARMPFSFTDYFYGTPEAFAVGKPSFIVLRGDALLRCDTWEPLAEASRRSREIDFRIYGDENTPCGDLPARYRYRAVIPELEPGRYRVRVHGEFDNRTSGSGPALTNPVAWKDLVLLDTEVVVR